MDSLHTDIANDYYGTTATRNHQRTRAWYDACAATISARFGDWLPSGADQRCLDLACGCGDMLYTLESRGVRDLTGVDLCKEELDEAREFVKAKLVCADVLEYLRSLPSSSVDFVSALNFLEHVPKETCRAILAEVSRILRPGGTMVAMVPNAISPFSGITRHWDITHEWAFVPNNFRQLAALVGLSPEVEVRECGPYPHGLVSGIRYLLWQAIRLCIKFRLMVELADTKGGVYTMDMLVRLRAGARPKA
jgi:ubiquinone/menaquinone biosynthesis C-methylase UbiE